MWLPALLLLLAGDGGMLVLGDQRASYELRPRQADFQLPSYANNGFEQMVTREEGTTRIRVRVTNTPLKSETPAGPNQLSADLGRLQTRLDAAAPITRVEQVSLVLDWLRRDFVYEDGVVPGSTRFMLANRRGNCVGFSNLAIYALGQLGIRARYVTGLAYEPDDQAKRLLEGPVLHRWIEVYYEDVGWVFSDPAGKINFVEGTYIVFGIDGVHPIPETLARAVSSEIELLSIDNNLHAVAREKSLHPSLLIRPNERPRR